MLIQDIKRKVHKLFHPVRGEILMLHRVVKTRSDDAVNRQLEITPEFFEETIKNYEKKNYSFVSINQVVEILSDNRREKKFVCITFDDGFADNFEYAYPILKKHNCPFTIYVTTGFIDGKIPVWWYNDKKAIQESLILKRDQLLLLANDILCTIGAHSVSHPRLTKISSCQMEAEIAESKIFLEGLIGGVIEHFAYPHGDFDERVTDAVMKYGYKSAVIANGGKIRKGDKNLFLIKRVLLEQR